MDLKKDRTFETDNTLLPGWSKAQLTSADFIPQDGDSIERITTLGVKLTNPYLIPNMQQAYTNLGLSSSLATITNKYVRFKPTVAQLAALDSTMDAQGLELFDTPVDYVVTYEGDYYQDPSIPDSLPTWQYAVVPTNFVFPSGIIYEILAQIHIPGDNYTAIETEAERLASLQDSLNGGGSAPSGLKGGVQPNSASYCDPCFVWDPIARECVPIGNGCGTNPPPPAVDAAIPAGYIYVHDTNLNTDIGVRKVRVVARRWFKVDRTYTDNAGHFVCTKKFKHKVRILERFKNDDARIYGVRGWRLYQMLFPVKRTLGIFSGTKNNLNLFNNQAGPINSKANRYWAAATTHNAVQEHRDYAGQFSFSVAPSAMNIFITNWAALEGLASTPLFHKRVIQNIPTSFINTFLASQVISASKLVPFFAIVNVDMAIDYHTTLARFTSDWLKETDYHEMSHASHFTKAGTAWYNQFVTAELNQIAAHTGANDPLNPYGSSNTPDAPIIALGEGWAYHMGHFLADQRYGVNATCTDEGQFQYCPSNPPPLVAHPHTNVLEFYIPTLSSDPFHWIPKGLMEDLIDNGEPVQFTQVNDLVLGLTTSQIFSALQSDVTTVSQYKTRLLQQIGNGQLNNINNLFTSYGY